MFTTMRDVMQDMEGAGYESGLSLLVVRDDGPIEKDGKPSSLRKYTVVGSFVSPPIFEQRKKPGKDSLGLPDPNTLTQLWQGEFSFRKEIVHTNPAQCITGFRSLNEIVECGGLNPEMYEKHEHIS